MYNKTATDLTSLQAQFNLHLACLCANPHVNLRNKQTNSSATEITAKRICLTANMKLYLFPIVQKHDVVIGQVILTEVGALLGYSKVTLLIGAPETKGQIY